MVTVQRDPGDLPSLADRFEAEQGEFFFSGMQALVRVLLDRRRRDAAAGLNTAAFVSGYPGSPLGGLDRELERQRTFLDRWGVVHRPGLNEDLAVTAVMGSQLATTVPDARVDGVLGVWYGKAPGLDRSMDALRHAVYAGASPLGGALVLVGDDPASKSSTLPSASERILAEVSVPVLAPGTIQEVLDYGVHAVELSRRSGLWAALKMVTPVADGTGTALVGLDRPTVVPSTLIAADRVSSSGITPPGSLAVERQLDDRLDAARDYAVANGVNRIVVDPPNPWLTIVAGGHPFHQTVEALANLGLTLRDLADYGVRLVNLGLVYPLVPAEVARWAAGSAELLVVEEKRSFVEQMIKDILYAQADRPAVLGKTDSGQPLVPGGGLLTADRLVEPLRRVLAHRLPADALRPATRRETILPMLAPQESRTAFFCSGCPHPTGLKAPEEFTIGAGIGCHNLVKMLPSSRVGDVVTLTQMGGEGAQWAGIEPFIPPRPFVQNIGDGTFMHSGSLAVRFAVASGLHMTYKILFNSAIAMTGGQNPVGERAVPDLCRLLLAEGVTAVTVTTDDPGRYRHVTMPKGAKVLDRSEVVDAQRELAALPGVTVLIHDQPCAAELRRLRKTGKASTPGHRLVINQAVCEGCGDCGAKSACLSLQPVMTDLCRKTAIQQTSCNLDFSCLAGDCPSFMEVRPPRRTGKGAGRQGGTRRRRTVPEVPVALPDPSPIVDPTDVRIRMPGIGGTGVVTVAQILGVAAGLDGKDVAGVDQTGVSQKAGPVVSEVHITDPGLGSADAEPTKAKPTKVDVMVALDLIVALAPAHLDGLSPEATVVIGSTSPTSTGSMVMDSRQPYPDTAAMQAALEARARPGTARWVDGAAVTQALFGDSTTANVFVLGAAYQHGAIPVAAAAIERAIELNGAAVEVNLAAFRWGRCAVAAPDQLVARLGTADPAAALPADLAADLAALRLPEATDRLVARRAADLVGYQGRSIVRRFLGTVATAWAAEQAAAPASVAFTEAVARQLYRVTAYKDEYEVARLLTGPEATAQAEAVGGPGARVTWMLHPPALRALGRKNKMGFAPWTRPAMAALRHGRFLRGTALDPFGRAEVRREERQLAADVDALCRSLADRLDEVGAAEAARIVSLAEQVRGYEHVKLGNLTRYRAELAEALGELPTGAPRT